ncbi:MAG: TIR domain-containing protein, partial [Okeania sp. SIO2H7]|nr:TIR domain-containing protein [Okeania sp. SIO2H7]
DAFMAGESIRLGENWPERIEAELKKCDYLLLLLSEQSASSEMVAEEVRRAKELQDSNPNGKPRILPIRVDFPMSSPLNYNLYGYLNQIQQREWNSPADTPNLIAEVIGLLAGEIAPEKPTETKFIAPKVREDIERRPLPAAAPELPEGQVSLNSGFYVERPPIERRCYEEIAREGSLIRIKAPRQMGKTSLMARILHHSSTNLDYKTLSLSFQLGEGQIFANLDKFLQWFCANVALELDLPIRLNDFWNPIFGSKVACKSYFEKYLLKSISTPLVLGLDEVDAIFQYPEIASDFFGLLRAWHEEAKNREIWKKLRLLVVHSTEAYVPMDINQSPFNVGLPIELPEFNRAQILDLAGRYQLNWNDENVDRLMEIVGGHPYLVRLALYHIARGDRSLDELLETAATDGGIYGDHLRRHLWILQQRSELAEAAKKVVSAAEPIQLDSMQGFKLHSIGIVNLQGNLVRPRCNLYRLYLSDRLGGVSS